MNYCEKCYLLCDAPICPNCGGRKLRAPKAGDYCFLAEKPVMWADMLRSALKDGGVPSAYRPILGAALAFKIGRNLEAHQIFVPYEHYGQAQDILMALFGSEEGEIHE